jgi:hypothetical protein
MDLKEIGCEGMTWIGLSQDREKWVVINLGFHKMRGIFLTT